MILEIVTLVSENHDIVLFERRSTASESTLSLIRVFLTVLSTIHCTSIEEIRFNKKDLVWIQWHYLFINKSTPM